MYDWPEPFCDVEHFPSLVDQPVRGARIDEENFPIFSNSNGPQAANVYAAQWRARLGLDGNAVCISKTTYPIEWNFGCLANPERTVESAYSPPPAAISIQLIPIKPGTAPRTIKASNVIMPTGIGAEREMDGYQSPPFWSVNRQAPWAILPVKKPTGMRNIVISGAGDGAIQDVLKSLFGKPIATLIPVAEFLLSSKEKPQVKARLLAAERHAERQLLWGVDEHAVYRALQEVYDGIVGAIDAIRVLRWKTRYLRSDVHVDWVIGQSKAFSKAFPLNRILASALKRKEFNKVLTIHPSTLRSVDSQAAHWDCTTSSDAVLQSDYPPLVRHGIETYDIDLPDDVDQGAIRIALSRSPLPFKPFDF